MPVTVGTNPIYKGDRISWPTGTADPSSPSVGDLYYNTDDTQLKCYDGSGWTIVGASGSTGGGHGWKNDGTVWSNSVTLSSGGWDGGRGPDKAFNGFPGTIWPGGFGAKSSSDKPLATFTLNITVTRNIVVDCHTGYEQEAWVTVDGTSHHQVGADGKIKFETPGNLTEIKFQNTNSGGRTVLEYIMIDDQLMIDNLVQ